MASTMSAVQEQAPATPALGELPVYRDDIVRTTRSSDDLCLLNYRLQSTLELEELLRLFAEEVKAQVDVDDVRFERDRTRPAWNIDGRDGAREDSTPAGAGFSVDYPLWLADQYLGRVSFRSRRIFAADEVKRLGSLVVALIYPLRNALLFWEAGQREPLLSQAAS
ncbi:MAG TPA: hypothetical protein VKA64_10125 [Gammaproteobacteria bacterium]|nr:hypothetical protein [Gammaproteobacteria bacterium]